jgi:hypothetical protein
LTSSLFPTHWPVVESPELLDLRQKHIKIPREKLQPTHQAWFNMLQEMSAGKDTDREIVAEKNRVTKLLVGATAPATPSVLTDTGKKLIRLNPMDKLSVTSAGSLRAANSGTHYESIMTGARISFRILPGKVPAGSYQVVVLAKVGTGMGGAYHIRVKDKSASGTMKPQGSNDSRWEPQGRLRIPAEECYLEFHVDSTLQENGSLCDLYGIELYPVDGK